MKNTIKLSNLEISKVSGGNNNEEICMMKLSSMSLEDMAILASFKTASDKCGISGKSAKDLLECKEWLKDKNTRPYIKRFMVFDSYEDNVRCFTAAIDLSTKITAAAI